MHSQEPWQSRSPTGGVNKPSISSTLRKTGRKGPHHSYGRGLPVKRKALVILTVAILAFAMVPAIGAGAAAGSVKIATPDELANRSGTSGSAFDRLDSADYVSDKTGTPANDLEDAGGTLYVVIEDNDKTANTLTDYYAFYTTIPGAADRGGNLFNINPLTTATGNGASPVAVTDSKGNFIGGTDSTTTATDSTATDDVNVRETKDLNDLVVGNRDREGGVDDNDIEVHLGYYTPATRGDATADPVVEAVAAKFTATRRVVGSFEAEDEDGNDGVFLDLDAIPLLSTVAIPTEASDAGAVAAMRLTFASAGVNDLKFTTGATAGQSRVQVTSTSGESIRVPVSEKNLGAFSGAGVTRTALNANESRDSGVFVGIFGAIENRFKDAASDWAPVKSDAADGTAIAVTVAANGTNPIPANQVEAQLSDATAPFTNSLSVTLAEVNVDNELVASSVNVTVTTQDPARDTDSDTATSAPGRDDGIDNPVAVTSTTIPSEGDGVLDPATGVVTVTFITDKVITTSDVFAVNFQTRDLNNNIDDLIASVDATGTADATDQSLPFDEFCDGSRPDDESAADRDKRCADVLDMSKALAAHQANLELADDVDASMLLGMLIGVEHGDTLTVRYSDASPRSTRTASAQVDLVGPTISGLNPSNGSYLDTDNFTMLFDVTDQDSGIPEEAQDPGEAEIRDGVAYVMHTMLVGVGVAATEPPDANGTDGSDIDRDEEITDGERYEIDVDVSEAADAAEGDANTDPVTVRVKVTINAYDIARNKAKPLVVNYVIDTIDPVMERAVTGVGLKTSNAVDGQYVLLENQANSIVLVFDDAIKGDEVRAQDINIVGSSVSNVTWLNNSGTNKISVGNTELSKDAGDLDYDAKTATTDRAGDIVKDVELARNTKGQDARHLLFLTLEADLGTGERPNVEIDGDDLVDLADNTNRSDHEAKPIDRLLPSFTVSLEQALSNDSLGATITASEDLDRTPRARIVRMSNDDDTKGPITGPLSRSLSLSSGTSNTWNVSTDRKGLGLTAGGGVQDGVYEVEITGTDDNANRVTVNKGKWELDTRANKGADPARVGGDADKAVAQKIETNDVIFLNLEFKGEAGEYYSDSKKKVNIDSLSLETLAGDAIGSNNKIVTNPTVESTVDVDAASAQTSDGVKHVIALSELAIGSYRLQVGFSDEAGNTGKFGYVFKITAPAPAEIDVVPGWSLVSIPGTPADLSIGGVLAGSAVTDVWSLNNETKVWEFARQDENGEWMGTLTQIVDGRAYFVRSTTFDPIKVLTERFDPQRTPSQYTVTAGWNGIGYTPAGGEEEIAVDAYLSSLGASGWGMIRTWDADATPPQYETYFSSGTATYGFPDDENGVAVVEKGKGYLLFATRNGVIGG